MATDPNYVRLAQRLTRGIVADVHGSGWSIAGLDVKEFPKDTAAAKFVRKALNDGKVEPAGKAEFEEAHSEDEALLEALLKEDPHYLEESVPIQEGRLRQVAKRAQDRVEKARLGEPDPEEEYDQNVRQPRLARARGAQSSLPDDLDDASKSDLQELARQRGLSTSGSKQELYDRISEHDANEGEDE